MNEEIRIELQCPAEVREIDDTPRSIAVDVNMYNLINLLLVTLLAQLNALSDSRRGTNKALNRCTECSTGDRQ